VKIRNGTGDTACMKLVELRQEAESYHDCAELQRNNVIPVVINHIEIWDLFECLVFADVGTAADDWTVERKEEAKHCLTKVHAQGCVHGDVSQANFIVPSEGLRILILGVPRNAEPPRKTGESNNERSEQSNDSSESCCKSSR
jgi:hypothetical protein